MEKLLNIGNSMRTVMPGYYDLGMLSLDIRSIITNPETDVIRLNNGYWSYRAGRYQPSDGISYTKSALLLKNYLDNRHIPFLYIQPPRKICQYDKELPYGEKNYLNENMDDVLYALRYQHVDCVDMRTLLHGDQLKHYSLFYKTDHHWNVEAGLWAARKIEVMLNEKYGWHMDQSFLNRQKYEKVVYPKAMFGSAGHAVTHFSADSEDFYMLYPKFDTDFSLTIPDKEVDSRGTFQEQFMDYQTLQKVMNAGGGYAYETILYGNRPLVQIRNHKNPDGPRILLIRDSFAIAVAPFLATGCSELDMIDVRPGQFNGSVRAYIDQTHPDLVMILVCSPLGERLK